MKAHCMWTKFGTGNSCVQQSKRSPLSIHTCIWWRGQQSGYLGGAPWTVAKYTTLLQTRNRFLATFGTWIEYRWQHDTRLAIKHTCICSTILGCQESKGFRSVFVHVSCVKVRSLGIYNMYYLLAVHTYTSLQYLHVPKPNNIHFQYNLTNINATVTLRSFGENQRKYRNITSKWENVGVIQLLQVHPYYSIVHTVLPVHFIYKRYNPPHCPNSGY